MPNIKPKTFFRFKVHNFIIFWQVITLSHTLLQNKKLTGVNKIMVVCPVNTVFNWRNEFKKWLPKKSDLNVFELVSCKQMYEKRHRVAEWHEDGGVMIIGYTMFRNISNPDNKKIQKKIRETFLQGLVDPGKTLILVNVFFVSFPLAKS